MKKIEEELFPRKFLELEILCKCDYMYGGNNFDRDSIHACLSLSYLLKHVTIAAKYIPPHKRGPYRAWKLVIINLFFANHFSLPEVLIFKCKYLGKK